MDEQENVQIVQESYAAFGRGDVAAFLATFDDGVDWLTYGPADLPIYGPRRGRDQVAAVMSAATDLLEIQEFEPREYIAQGDRVVVLGYERGTSKSSGKAYELHWVDVFTLKNHKVARFRGYWDSASIVAAARGA